MMHPRVKLFTEIFDLIKKALKKEVVTTIISEKLDSITSNLKSKESVYTIITKGELPYECIKCGNDYKDFNIPDNGMIAEATCEKCNHKLYHRFD